MTSPIMQTHGLYDEKIDAGDWVDVADSMRRTLTHGGAGGVVITQPFADADKAFAFFDFPVAYAAMKAGHLVSRRSWYHKHGDKSAHLRIRDGVIEGVRGAEVLGVASLASEDLTALDWECKRR